MILKTRPRERLGVVRLALGVLALRRVTLDRRHVARRRQVGDDRVQQRLDRLVLERGAAGAPGTPSPARVARRIARRSSSTVASSSWTNFSIRDSSWSASFSNRSWCACSAASCSSAGISVVSHSSPISETQCSAFISTRSITPWKSPSLPHGSCRTSGFACRRSTIISTVRPKSAPVRSILFTKPIRGTRVPVGLAPDRLGLGLDAGDRVEHRDRAVEHAQRPLHLDREVDVAGRVDDVDPVTLPVGGRRGRGDRDPALALLDHPVHQGGALVDLADLVGLAGVVQDALGRGRLARVDVRHDPDVPGPGERVLADHQLLAGTGSASCDLLDRLCHVHLLRGHRHDQRPPSSNAGLEVSPATSLISITIGSARTPCSPRPSCACPRGASPRRPGRWRRP